MKSNINYLLFLAMFMCASIAVHAQKDNKAKRPPNIIFILADDLGWADLPVYGNSFNEAPNITRLANEGMKFTQAYAAAPVCSPTRASILSGQYPARVGITDFLPGHWRPYEKVQVPVNRTQFLPEKIITVGEALREAGYATGYIGKWHLGNKREHHPLNQGFNEAHVGQGYYNVRFNPPREEHPEKRLTEHLADFSTEFIEKHKNEPFFLFISHFDVHVQLDAEEDLIRRYLNTEKTEGYPGNAIYAAMIAHLDKSVGRIMDKLDELNVSDNTLIVFFSDNGGLVKRFDEIPLIADTKRHIYEGDSLLYVATSNAPLRGEKGTLYEGGIREPLIVKWPERIKAGTTSDAIITSVDFFPTLVEIAGGKMPGQQAFDGKSMVPVLLDNIDESGRALFWHYPVYHHDVPASAVRKGDWKLIENLVDKTFELYNLKEDIGESLDLSASRPDKARELLALLTSWRSDLGAGMPVPNPDFNQERRYEWGKHPHRAK